MFEHFEGRCSLTYHRMLQPLKMSGGNRAIPTGLLVLPHVLLGSKGETRLGTYGTSAVPRSRLACRSAWVPQGSQQSATVARKARLTCPCPDLRLRAQTHIFSSARIRRVPLGSMFLVETHHNSYRKCSAATNPALAAQRSAQEQRPNVCTKFCGKISRANFA